MAKNNKTQNVPVSVPATVEKTDYVMKLFSSAETAGEGKGIVRRNMPAMVKPGDCPVGQAISGEIIKIVPSPVSTVKGKLLWLRHENGTEFTFPCTGTIRAALAPGLKNEDEEKLQSVLEKEVGNILVCVRQPDRLSNKFKKSMFVFDVFTKTK